VGRCPTEHQRLRGLSNFPPFQRYTLFLPFHGDEPVGQEAGSSGRAVKTLLIPPDELLPTRFERVPLWQEIVEALLKKYADAYYKARKVEWEAPQLVYQDLDPTDANMVKEYRFLIEHSEVEIQQRLNDIKDAVE
jgi:hypothetical protein